MTLVTRDLPEPIADAGAAFFVERGAAEPDWFRAFHRLIDAFEITISFSAIVAVVSYVRSDVRMPAATQERLPDHLPVQWVPPDRYLMPRSGGTAPKNLRRDRRRHVSRNLPIVRVHQDPRPRLFRHRSGGWRHGHRVHRCFERLLWLTARTPHVARPKTLTQ